MSAAGDSMRPIDLPVTANVPELILLRTWAASEEMPCIRVLGMIGSGNEALNTVRANILAKLFCHKQIGKSFDRLWFVEADCVSLGWMVSLVSRRK